MILGVDPYLARELGNVFFVVGKLGAGARGESEDQSLPSFVLLLPRESQLTRFEKSMNPERCAARFTERRMVADGSVHTQRQHSFYLRSCLRRRWLFLRILFFGLF